MGAIRRNIRLIGLIAFVAIATQLALYYLYLHESSTEFVQETRRYFIVGIAVAFIYKEFIIFMMMLTTEKRRLDWAFIWATQAVALLFVIAYVNIEYPLLAFTHPIFFGWMWLNIWVDVALSSALVVYYLYCERIRPIVQYIREFGWPGVRFVWNALRGRNVPV